MNISTRVSLARWRTCMISDQPPFSFSYLDWRCFSRENLLTEQISEELTPQKCWSNNRSRVCDKKCDYERRCNSKGVAVGHRRAREVPCHHGCSLPKGPRLPNSVWHHAPKDLLKCKVLDRIPACLGWTGHLHNARGQQARRGAGGPQEETSNPGGGTQPMLTA